MAIQRKGVITVSVYKLNVLRVGGKCIGLVGQTYELNVLREGVNVLSGWVKSTGLATGLLRSRS